MGTELFLFVWTIAQVSGGVTLLATLGKLCLHFCDSRVGPLNTQTILYATFFLLSIHSVEMDEKIRSYQLVMTNSGPEISYNIEMNVSLIWEKF